MGFANVRAFADAVVEGRDWVSTYRKAPAAAATIAGQWFDYSYAGGNPIANYYASAPLEAATLNPARGIIVPRLAAGERQWLHRWTAMSAASGATSTANQNQFLMLLDYLMYYPFIDMDAVGDAQQMILTSPAVTLPRYASGVGVQVMLVAQQATVGSGRFTMTYTDHAGVSQTTASHYCVAAQPAGALVCAAGGAGGVSPFVPLNAGSRGVRSIESFTFSVANGGLCAAVLVKPLAQMWLREECRRTTSGTVESFGDAAELEALRTRAGLVEILDGAFLGIIGRGAAGSLASSVLTGTIETVRS